MRPRLDVLMDIYEIRLINMNYLIQTVKSIKVFADIVETSPTVISQIRSEKTKKQIGSELARRIEKAFGKKHGWLDKLHYDEEADYTSLSNKDALSLAIARVMNQLIAAEVYEPKKKMDSEVFSSLVVAAYDEITNARDLAKPVSENKI